jgi:hypothetical protein
VKDPMRNNNHDTARYKRNRWKKKIHPENTGVVVVIRPRPLPFAYILVHNSLIILPFNAILADL